MLVSALDVKGGVRSGFCFREPGRIQGGSFFILHSGCKWPNLSWKICRIRWLESCIRATKDKRSADRIILNLIVTNFGIFFLCLWSNYYFSCTRDTRANSWYLINILTKRKQNQKYTRALRTVSSVISGVYSEWRLDKPPWERNDVCILSNCDVLIGWVLSDTNIFLRCLLLIRWPFVSHNHHLPPPSPPPFPSSSRWHLAIYSKARPSSFSRIISLTWHHRFLLLTKNPKTSNAFLSTFD